MPVTYTIDLPRKLIRTHCVGSVRLPEVLAHFETLRKDPSLPRDSDVLLSLVGLDTPPDTPQLYAVADNMGLAPPLRFRYCAIVADRDLVFGIARMFQAIGGRHFQEVQVFRDAPAALTWLASIPR
jgi:hypothetical protein